MSISAFDPRIQLGLRIKELRARNKITQEELADRCQLFRTYLSRVESGQANPTLTVLHALAQGLEVPVQELLVPPLGPEDARHIRVRADPPISRGRVLRT
ncbi:MAG: helix-turn-helix domain-containing protein [Comamonas sp.]|nr:helix-turn-helix domain-containing protein [Comamonas sp.]